MLPFSYSSDVNASEEAISSDPESIALPGPCTVNTAPAWGCPSNVIHVQRIPHEEMDRLCAGALQLEHPVVLVYRNFPNVMHWLSDQVVPFFFALDEFGLSNQTIQIIALDEGAWHGNAQRSGFLDGVWRDLSGGLEIFDMADHVKETFCARTAIFGSPAHPLTSYNVELPLHTVLRNRPRHQRFAQWVLSRYNLTHLPENRGDRQPVITIIDRTAEMYRTIMNQEQFISIATSFTPNVRSIKLEGMSIVEQLQVAVETDILIGVHGAGLAMGAFLPPWGVLVELKPFGYGTGVRDFYPGFCQWARLHGIQFMGWHNRDRALSMQAGQDPLYFKNFHTYLDLGNITLIIKSAIELATAPASQRKINECTQLNEPMLPQY